MISKQIDPTTGRIARIKLKYSPAMRAPQFYVQIIHHCTTEVTMKGKQIYHRTLTIFTAIWLAAAFSANAGTWGDLTYSISSNQVTITGCDRYAEGDLVIPNTIEGYPVTFIGSRAFYYRSDLTSVVIPDGVISIEATAFYSCSSLTNMVIPDSVNSIGANAFTTCRSLTNITIPDGVTIIERFTFEGCRSLSRVTIPASVTTIGESAFEACSSLSSITIPASVTTIEESAFARSGLKSIVIPDSVIFIGEEAFYNIGLTSVVIPDSSIFIGSRAFYNNPISRRSINNITYLLASTCAIVEFQSNAEGDIVIPSEVDGLPVRHICGEAFSDNSDITQVTIPYGINFLNYLTFSSCSSLTNVVLPDSVTHIGDGAFILCSSLTNVEIPESVTHIGDNVFSACSSLTSVNIPDGVTRIGDSTFDSCSSLTSVGIPNSVTHIGDAAFIHCSSLTNVEIPESVTHIGEAAFSYSALTNVTTPYGITSISDEAFSGCSNLKNITIPYRITSIGGSAFKNCTNLTSVALPYRVKSIGAYAFRDCYSLSTITIPGSITNIGYRAFYQCYDLTNALFKGDAPEEYSSLFSRVSSEFTVQFYEGANGFTTPRWDYSPCEMIPAPAGGFETWVADLPSEQRNPDDAPDRDGIPNLIKYAAGLAPGFTCNSADLLTCLVEKTPSNTVLTLTYFKDPAATNVMLYPIASSSLTDEPSAWSTNSIRTVNMGTIDNYGRNIWRAELTTGNEKGFMRLTAEAE